jgi:hypothetical protein
VKHLPIICALFLATAHLTHAQDVSVACTVRDTSMVPLNDVVVFIKDGRLLGRTDGKGFFSTKLAEGTYELVFSNQQYERAVVPVTLRSGAQADTFVVLLTPKMVTYDEVVITTRRKDPAPEVMRQAIRSRDRWASQFQSLQSELYIRAVEQVETPPAKKRSGFVAQEEEYADSLASAEIENDSNRVSFNMAEVVLTRHFRQPGKVKEVRNGVSKRGDPSGLFYLSTTEADFSLNRNLIYIPSLSDQPMLSPLSSTAMLGYKFKLLKILYDSNGTKVYRISVKPRQTANALFSGVVEVVDSLFYLRAVSLDFPPHVLNEYDKLSFSQKFSFQDSFLLPQRLDLNYTAKAGKARYSGNTMVRYRSHVVNKSYPPRFFDNELSSASKEAYERDSSYWAGNRMEPLNEQELRFVNRDDSIRRVRESKAYKDSITRDINKVTLSKLFLFGQEYVNPDKGWDLGFIPLLFIYNPAMIGGGRVNLRVGASKELKNKQRFSLSPNLNMGVNNKDLKGDISGSWLYNPFSRGTISVSMGRNFGFINPFDAYINLFRRSNFYEHNYLNLTHRGELLNGLYLGVAAEFSDRRDISGYRFDAIGDSLFPDNRPVRFDPYTAAYTRFTLWYTPFQKYMREPYQKVILGSNWPTFVAQYRKGWKGVAGSQADFDYLEFRMEHEFPLGLVGRSEFRMTTGRFYNSRNVQLIDYKYQRRGDPFLLTAPLYTFQMLDSTYPTFNRYFDGHYIHRFNGSIVNKIPFMKFLELREVAGGSFLFSSERNMRHIEAFAGIERVFRLWRERIKIGFYYSAATSNQWNGLRSTWKFGFSTYDRFTNQWN